MIARVVIVGRDVAAWLSANVLQRALGRTGVSVEVIEMPSRLRTSDVLASLPALEALHRLLGIDESDLLRATSGGFSLGQSFANFSRTQAPFFHPYGSHGVEIDRLPFFPFWVKARREGLNVAFEDFALSAAAAKQGRFFVPTAKTKSFAKCDYAYHLRADGYAQYLKARAVAGGVKVYATRGVDVRRSEETGDVISIHIDGGAAVKGDFFIDATGTDSLLLGKALGVAFDSWREWFPFDRAIACELAPLKSSPAHSQVRALDRGCLHLAPVRGATALVGVYDSGRLSDAAALSEAHVVTGLAPRSEAVVSDLHPGRRKRLWEQNVVAVGEAGVVFDPIDNVATQALHYSLVHLLTLFPLAADAACERKEYERVLSEAIEGLRSFQISHYKLNRNLDSEVWDRTRAMPVPDILLQKIDLFLARGVVPIFENETFDVDNWLAVFVGHGLMPSSYDPIADQTDPAATIQTFQKALGFIGQQVQSMSSHDAYLEVHLGG